jgi:hypothetical protein
MCIMALSNVIICFVLKCTSIFYMTKYKWGSLINNRYLITGNNTSLCRVCSDVCAVSILLFVSCLCLLFVSCLLCCLCRVCCVVCAVSIRLFVPCLFSVFCVSVLLFASCLIWCLFSVRSMFYFVSRYNVSWKLLQNYATLCLSTTETAQTTQQTRHKQQA